MTPVPAHCHKVSKPLGRNLSRRTIHRRKTTIRKGRREQQLDPLLPQEGAGSSTLLWQSELAGGLFSVQLHGCWSRASNRRVHRSKPDKPDGSHELLE